MPAATFFFGAMSPYSWFAAERIGALIPHARWRPVYAGALFKASGRSTWGLGPDRARRMADCEQRAAAHRLGPIRWPDPWPTNDVLVARALTFADERGGLPAFALSAMRIAFTAGGDLGDLAVLQTAGLDAGIDPAQLADAVSRPEVKDAVRATHDAARALGVFGVPTVVVGGELFWGDDRLDAAAGAAAGAAAAADASPGTRD